MMKLRKIALAILALLSAPAMADTDTFKPSGPWAADYGDDYCLLGRVFSNGSDEVTLELKRTQPGQFFRLILIGDAVKLYRGATTLGYSLLPAGGDRDGMILRGKTADGKAILDLGVATILAMAMPAPGSPPTAFKPYRQAEERASAKSVTGIEFSRGATKPARLETGSLDAPIGALQTCVNDLIAQWGVDAKAHETLTRNAMPAGPVSAWVPANTYPFTEFPKLVGDLNEIRVLVDATGAPTKCVVDRPSAAVASNDAACAAIMKNGKFLPALDAQGQPIASFWITPVFGLLPPMPGAGR